MPSAVLHDKVGRSETIPVQPGMRVSDVLRAHGVPVNAVLTWINGAVVPEHGTVIEPDDHVEFRQVRHYDLGVTRSPATRLFSDVNPIYSKSVLFDEGGNVEHRIEQLSAERYPQFVEETFVQSVHKRNMFQDGDKIAVGLSGGSDSVAFLTLLERTRDRLPEVSWVAVTVVGLPDWDEPATFGAARESCRRLGVEHVVVSAEDIERVFQLSSSFVDTMTDVVAGASSSMVMVVTHHVMRRMIEVEAVRADAGKIALGLNADDLVASLVTWFTSGFPMGPLPVRHIGEVDYLYPLFSVTKKELTLYLELVAPELNRQGAPGRFTTGPGERSLAYAMTDHLYDLWPGVDHYLFSAFDRMQSYFLPMFDTTCAICGATYMNLKREKEESSDTCDVCTLFRLLPAGPR